MIYSPGELKDLMMLVLHRYEEYLGDVEMTPETTAVINNWVMKHGDEILEDHQCYLTYLNDEADRAIALQKSWDEDNGY